MREVNDADRRGIPLAQSDDRSDGGRGGNQNDRGPRVTGVRYGAMRWVGEFRIPSKLDFPCGVKVVVQTERGIELGEHLTLTCAKSKVRADPDQIDRYVENSGPEFYRPRSGRVLRQATDSDVRDHEHLNAHNREDIRRCTQEARVLELDMKVVTVEHLLGGERIVFYFRSEGRIDFRELVRRLARHYQTRIEMRQVGARDEARLVADYEVCGREVCCKGFLKKLRPVTMKMAKLQKSTLDPSKVSGRCGRLRCCLRYENEGYEELVAKLPRMNSRVETVMGPGRVIDRQVLTQLLLIRLDADDRTIAFPVEEIGPVGTKLTVESEPPGALLEDAGGGDASGTEEPAQRGREGSRREQSGQERRGRRGRRSRRREGEGKEGDPRTGGAAGSGESGEVPNADAERRDGGSETGGGGDSGGGGRGRRGRRRPRRGRRRGGGGSRDGGSGSDGGGSGDGG